MANKEKILIVGATSRSAEAITRTLKTEMDSDIVLASTNPNLQVNDGSIPIYTVDFTDRKELKKVCLKERPDIIVNTSAITNVDYCEKNRKEAWNVNVRGVENLVQMCRVLDAHLIHFSSDYVFDGRLGPYTETDVPNPVNYYGKTKLASENVCATGNISYTVVRTNVIYGATAHLRVDFVLWVLNKLNEGKPFNVVNDQFNNPTLTDDLAYATSRLIIKKRTGIYNVAGSDYLSRYDFALAIAKVFKYENTQIGTMCTDDLKQLAKRPLQAGLITFKSETDLGIKFSDIESGLLTMRRQLQMFGHRDWKL